MKATNSLRDYVAILKNKTDGTSENVGKQKNQ
jgi:hypothetical protein